MIRSSWSALLWVSFAAAFAAAAGCGQEPSDGDGDAGPTGREACLDQEIAADELVPEAVATDLPGPALRLGADSVTAVVCGTTFALGVDLAARTAGDPVTLPAPCTGAAVDGSRAVVADGTGLVVLFDVGADGALIEVDRFEDAAPDAAYAGVLFRADTVYVAARAQGVLRFDASGGTLVPSETWAAATDALSVVAAGDRFAVGDAGGTVLWLDAAGAAVSTLTLPVASQTVDGPDGPEDVELPYEGQTVAVSDDWIVTGSGGLGYSYASRDGDTLGAPEEPTRPHFTDGPIFDLALHRGNEILYAEGGSIRRMSIAADGTLTRLASEYRPDVGSLDGGWWVGTEVVADGRVLLLNTHGLYEATLGEHVPAPDLDLDRYSMFVKVLAGEDAPATHVFHNDGDAPLYVWLESIAPASSMTAEFQTYAGLDVPDPNNLDCLPILPGGAGGVAQVVYTAVDTSAVEGLLMLSTTDPDEETVALTVSANPPELVAGQAAVDFTLTTLGGGSYSLVEHAGEVVLLKFFNST